MTHIRPWRTLAAGLTALLSGAFGMAPASAQTASEQAVKAGFVYNFIKFTQWSATREGDASVLHICTPGALPLEGQFAKLQGRLVGARPIEVHANSPSSDWRNCAVLFITETDASRLDAILRSLGNAPVLTVGDLPDFAKAGGMIELRMADSRVKFDVNLASAQRAGLQLNSQMLKLAGQVIK